MNECELDLSDCCFELGFFKAVRISERNSQSLTLFIDEYNGASLIDRLSIAIRKLTSEHFVCETDVSSIYLYIHIYQACTSHRTTK